MNSQEMFAKAIHFVEISEGGTNTDPLDRGGFTKYGISEKQYPNVDIKGLTRDDAASIYYQDYWKRNRCDKFDISVAIVLFDSSVNCGAGSAANWLQKIINRQGANLVIDGIIGPKTVSAASAYTSSSLVYGIIAYRLRRYANLLKSDRSQHKFVRGWIKRVANLLFYVE